MSTFDVCIDEGYVGLRVMFVNISHITQINLYSKINYILGFLGALNTNTMNFFEALSTDITG